MHFIDICKKYRFEKVDEQKSAGVTYVVVATKPVSRLKGKSDILYIGETKQAIKKRWDQETKTLYSIKCSQPTNLRMTYIINLLNSKNVDCYFTGQTIAGKLSGCLMNTLKHWDIKAYNKTQREIPLSLEKYFLIQYAADHLELPPLNNKV